MLASQFFIHYKSCSESKECKYVMRCAIWYHLYNFKNVKNTHGGVLLLSFFTSFKLYKWYQIAQNIKNIAVPQIKVKIMIIAGYTGHYYQVHEMSKHIAGYIFACCIAMVPVLGTRSGP